MAAAAPGRASEVSSGRRPRAAAGSSATQQTPTIARAKFSSIKAATGGAHAQKPTGCGKKLRCRRGWLIRSVIKYDGTSEPERCVYWYFGMAAGGNGKVDVDGVMSEELGFLFRDGDVGGAGLVGNKLGCVSSFIKIDWEGMDKAKRNEKGYRSVY